MVNMDLKLDAWKNKLFKHHRLAEEGALQGRDAAAGEAAFVASQILSGGHGRCCADGDESG